MIFLHHRLSGNAFKQAKPNQALRKRRLCEDAGQVTNSVNIRMVQEEEPLDNLINDR